MHVARHFITPTLFASVAFALFSVAACSSGDADLAGPTAAPSERADAGPDTPSSATNGAKDDDDKGGVPSCEPDPSCDRGLCQCDDDTVMATDGICVDGGSCNMVARCAAACGSAKFTGGVLVEKACSSEGAQCIASRPNVSCQCNQEGIETYGRCTKGHCSVAPMNVCPAACEPRGGWRCRDDADCTPIVCACKDGRSPATVGSCQGTSCAAPSAVCPSACSDHGGWAGSDGGPTGGGPTGPKQPGDACTGASECPAYDCGCQDGTSFAQLRSCQNKKCAGKTQTCSTACLSSGGWDGQ
ncbi:MAG: hypothetical protein KF850_29785 [Labilithrix sp.]|nr:hypothetical protein [Labilithrix sp.]MBX3216268.1 hypothetical protein [Labilithrix sp.]